MFSAPIMPNRHTSEDLNPDLSPQDRRKRFGQEDHLRIFGELDFMELIEVAGMTEGMIDLSAAFDSDALLKARLNPAVFETCNPHRVFVWRKLP